MNQNPIVTEARALLGVPFRLHGRDPNTALDCAGLLLSAILRSRWSEPECEQFSRLAWAPSTYAEAIDFLKSRAKVCRVEDIQAGDIIVGRGLGMRAAVGIVSQLEPRWLIHVTDAVIEELLPLSLNWSIAHVFRFERAEVCSSLPSV